MSDMTEKQKTPVISNEDVSTSTDPDYNTSFTPNKNHGSGSHIPSNSNGLRICSLENLEIELNDEIRRHLSVQYDQNRNKDDNNSHEIQSSEDGHLELILSAMKRPPAFTTCRVNLIRTTRKDVLDELRSLLSTTPQLKVLEDAGFPDVINIVPTALLPSDNDGERSFFENGDFDKSSSSSMTGPDGNGDDDKSNSTTLNIDYPMKTLFSSWPLRSEQGWSMTYRCIICDRFCGEAVLRGSDIFVMGVMAADVGIRAGENVAVYADIPCKASNGSGNGCVSSEKLLRGLKLEHYRGKCVYLGLGRAECSRNEIFKKTRGIAITMSLDANERVGPPLPPLYGVLSDKMMLQNLPSVLVGHALDPKANDIILDMCSAPGGKTSHLASLIRNDAIIVACDKSKKKVVAAKELFIRMGASCITPLALDATNCCLEQEYTKEENGNISAKEETKNVEQLLRDAPLGKGGLKQIKKFYEKSFDKILLDPPCSALGLRPKLFVSQGSVRELEKHAEYQQKFVNQAVKLLKVGGYMTYSTCTINGNENEGMVSHILKHYPCMEILPIDLPSPWRQKNLGLPGLDGFGLSSKERNCVCRFDPSSTGDTMGFFVARFRKHS